MLPTLFSLPQARLVMLTLRYRGGPHLRYVFHGRRGLFLRPLHVRDFVKEGYFFAPRYEVWGAKSPYNPQNIRGSDAE